MICTMSWIKIGNWTSPTTRKNNIAREVRFWESIRRIRIENQIFVDDGISGTFDCQPTSQVPERGSLLSRLFSEILGKSVR